MTHQECGDVWDVSPRMPNRPFDVTELVLPVRLPVRAVLALIRLIQCGLAESTSVVSEHGDASLWILEMHMVVSSDMLSKAVDENK